MLTDFTCLLIAVYWNYQSFVELIFRSFFLIKKKIWGQSNSFITFTLINNLEKTNCNNVAIKRHVLYEKGKRWWNVFTPSTRCKLMMWHILDGGSRGDTPTECKWELWNDIWEVKSSLIILAYSSRQRYVVYDRKDKISKQDFQRKKNLSEYLIATFSLRVHRK